MAKYYEYSVNLDDRYVRVVASDRLIASKMGANALGVVWRERARDMVIIQGREVKRKEIEKRSPSQSVPVSPSQSASLTAPPQGGAEPSAAAPERNTGSGKGAAAPERDKAKGAPTVKNRAVPTFKSGPLAGQPMHRASKTNSQPSVSGCELERKSKEAGGVFADSRQKRSQDDFAMTKGGR